MDVIELYLMTAPAGGLRRAAEATDEQRNPHHYGTDPWGARHVEDLPENAEDPAPGTPERRLASVDLIRQFVAHEQVLT